MEGKNSNISKWFEYGDVQPMRGGAAKSKAAAKPPCATFKNKAGQCKPWATCAKYQDLVRSTNTCKNKVCTNKFLNKTTGNCDAYKTCTAPDTLVKTTNTCKHSPETKETCAKKTGYHWNNTKKSCDKGECQAGEVLDVHGIDPKKCVKKGKEACATGEVKVKGVCEKKVTCAEFTQSNNKCAKWVDCTKKAGTKLDKKSNMCKKLTQAECKSPDVWNTTKKVCESSVSCSGNKPFKTKKNTCVAYATCKKAGTHLDEKTNTCAKDTKAYCDTKKDHHWDDTKKACLTGSKETEESCGKKTGYHWDDTKKACLTGSKETEESCGKKTGYHWNTKTKNCDKNVATCKKPQIKINGACEDPKKCAESESLDIKTNTCKACDGFMNKKGKCVPFLKCKEPKVLDKTTNTCSTPCPTGEVRPTKGAKQGKCVAKANCKEGEDYDAAGNTCKAKACATGEVRPTKGTQKGTCVAKATCKDKEKYDMATNTCKAVACVRGEVKPTAGPNKDTCVKKATCKAPRKVLNKATNECECPKGQSYDEKNKKCSACKEGEVTVNGQCVPKTECKENETIDKKTNTCICKPTFVKPAGTEKCVAKAKCIKPKTNLNKKTNECECPKGQLFSEKGNACLKCKTGEIIDTETGKCAKDTGAKNDTKDTTNSTTPAASVPLDAAALGTGVQSLTQSGLVSIAPPGSPYEGLPNYEGKGEFPGVPPPTGAPPTETSNELQEVVNKFKKGF